MKFFLLSPHKYPVISIKLNIYKTLMKLHWCPELVARPLAQGLMNLGVSVYQNYPNLAPEIEMVLTCRG